MHALELAAVLGMRMLMLLLLLHLMSTLSVGTWSVGSVMRVCHGRVSLPWSWSLALSGHHLLWPTPVSWVHR